MKSVQHRDILKSVAVIAALLFAGIANAAISNVQGTAANGQTLTINGSGFGSKSSPRPLYFWDFSVASAPSIISRAVYPGGVAGALTSAVVAPGSARSLAADISGITTSFGPTDGVPFSGDTLYSWHKVYYGFNIVSDGASNGLNLKFFRMWNPWTHDIYTGYQGLQGIDSGRTMPEQTQEEALYWRMPHMDRRWVVEEHEYKAGSLNNRDGIFNYSRNGLAAYPRSSRFITRTSAMPQTYSLLFFDQVSNNFLALGKMLYFDSIYIDDTFQRVIISDEPTWQTNEWSSSATQRMREIQLPTAWSDTSIQVTVRKGAIPNLSAAYLYVIGTDGNPVNQNGYALSAVGGKTPRDPSPVSTR